MLSAPVPCAKMFADTVPTRGLRASTIGSQEGLSAVPHPCHSRAASDTGASCGRGHLHGLPDTSHLPHTSHFRLPVGPARRSNDPSNLSSRSTPALRSIALLTSSDFGKPCP